MAGTESPPPPPATEWDLPPILDERLPLLRSEQPRRFSLVILNQPIHDVSLFLDLWNRATFRIAADGGANRVHAIWARLPARPRLDYIVGDLDSLRDETRTWFLEQHRQEPDPDHHGPAAPAGGAGSGTDTDTKTGSGAARIIYEEDQDSTDFAKAVQLARKVTRRPPHRGSGHGHRDGDSAGAGQAEEDEQEGDDAAGGDDIICYSGLGGRVDQAMSQLHHLYVFQRGRRRSTGGEGGAGGSRDSEADGNAAGYPDGRMYLTNGESLTFVLLVGRHRIRIRSQVRDNPAAAPTIDAGDGERETKRRKADDEGEESPAAVLGKHVGIIPLAGPSELTTRGLEWDVAGWRTEFGGRMSTSNHTTPGHDVVEVQTTTDVLFTIDLTPAPAPVSQEG